MSMSDPVADMLTRIRNAHMVEKKEVNITKLHHPHFGWLHFVQS
jgi:ribosomal protein S8